MEKQYRLSGNEVRQKFLDFFASKGCMIEPGASLIPHNDPTTAMDQCWCISVKEVTLMVQKSQHQIVSVMPKSIRTNDIENVRSYSSSPYIL